MKIVIHLERLRERTHLLDEKPIPGSKIEVSRSIGDSIQHSVPNRFLALMAASNIGPQALGSSALLLMGVTAVSVPLPSPTLPLAAKE
jgi:hypothetical protein